MKNKTPDDILREVLANADRAVSEAEGTRAQALYERHAQLHTQSHARTGNQLRILVVDDDPVFCDGMVSEADRLNRDGSASFVIHTLNPVSADEVVDVIECAHREKNYFDLLLLDYELRHHELTAENVLQALNNSKAPHIRYLPRLTITNKAEEQEVNMTDMLLSMGTDGIHLYKGGNVQAHTEVGQPHYSQILQSLRLSDYKEIRVRAWGRMWRDIRNRIEDAIALQRDTACTNHSTYCALLSQIWTIVFDELKDSNYVKRASLRVFNNSFLDSIKPIDEVLKKAEIEQIAWDHLPYVKRWLMVASEESKSATEWLSLHQQFLINKLERKDIGDPKLYSILEGRQTIGMPLFTHHGPIGLFTLVRPSTAPPFGASDWEQMLTVGLRLALHAQDLRNRWRAYDRAQTLHKLHLDLSNAESEEQAWQLAVYTVHQTVFKRIQGLHGTAQMPPPTGVDPNGRTSLRRMDPDRQLSGWGCGLIIGPDVQELKLLEASQIWNVSKAFDEGKQDFHPDTEKLPNYKSPGKGANRSLIYMPVKADGVCFAVFAVGHSQVGFFGASAEQSCDWQFLSDCADLLGQAMAQRRSASLQAAALDLLLNLSSEPTEAQNEDQSNEENWIEQVVDLLNNHAVGCAAVFCLKPLEPLSQTNATPWRLNRGWEFARPKDGEPKLYSLPSARIQEWQTHITEVWEGSFSESTAAKGDPLVRFTDKDFICDKRMGVHTASQLNLRIALTESSETMALLVLLFSVPKPINTPQQQEFLKRLSMLCAVYLQDRQRLQDLGNWQSLAQRNQDWSDAYQQMRHHLRSQIAEAERRIKKCLRELDDKQSVAQATASLTQLQKDMQQSSSRIVDTLNTSAVLTRKLQLIWHGLASLLVPVLQSVASRAEALGVEMRLEIDGALEIYTDGELLQLVVSNLLDNALDEFKLQTDGHSGRSLRDKGAPTPCICLCYVAPRQRDMAHEVLRPALLVQDNGPGVLPLMQADLFSGKSNKPLGSGFQLHFSNQALIRQGWGLAYWANVGPGACFAIELVPEALRLIHPANA